MSESVFPNLPSSTSSLPRWEEVQHAARTALEATALPSSSEEIWRYSRVDNVRPTDYAPITAATTIAAADATAIDELRSAFGGYDCIITVDGKRNVASDQISDSTRSILVAPEETTPLVVGLRDDAFLVASDAHATDVIAFDVPAKTEVATSVLLIHVLSQENGLSFPRLQVKLGESSSLKIVECFLSRDINALTIPVAELQLGDNAQLDHVVIQQLGEGVTSLARQSSELGNDAQLRSANLVFGGAFARTRNDTILTGRGAHSDLSAVYFGGDQQMHDFRTLQEHVGANTTSDLFFRGAVNQQAHAVYSGLIRIRKGAHGTNAVQSNRTLKLSPEAIADSVPNLEIDENQVKCSHASAVGPIDPEERYYLESRGIRTEDAERLIVLGFLDEVLDRIAIDGVGNYARKILSSKWDQK